MLLEMRDGQLAEQAAGGELAVLEMVGSAGWEGIELHCWVAWAAVFCMANRVSGLLSQQHPQPEQSTCILHSGPV